MPYTQLKLKPEYRDKLATLADPEHRSMANMVELLIDRELEVLEKQVAREITGTIDHQDLKRMQQNLKRRLGEWDGRLEELMAEGKKLGAKAGYQTEEQVAAERPAQRRLKERWRVAGNALDLARAKEMYQAGTWTSGASAKYLGISDAAFLELVKRDKLDGKR